jgi:drug/metabolite transporter (DMT)-like permease
MSHHDNHERYDHENMSHVPQEEEGTLQGYVNSLHLQLVPTGTTRVADEDIDSELANPLLEHSASSCESRDDENIQPPVIKSWQGPLLLLATSFLYATLNISLRAIYNLPGAPSPSALSMARGWIILGLFLPLGVHKRHCKNSDTTTTTSSSSSSSREQQQEQQLDPDPTFERPLWTVAAELAFWNFVGQALFTCGIELCPSARASFLGQTSVVMIPLLCALRGEALRWWDGMGCLCTIVGMILMSIQEQASDPDTETPDRYSNADTNANEEPHFGLSLGDILILSSALCWSFYVIKTSQYAKYFDEVYLQGSKCAILSLLYSGWFIVSSVRSDTPQWPGWQNGVAWAILIYSALGPGVIADLIQQKGQESAGATESNLILCMESLFTAILGRILLGEETSWMEKLGGSFLVAGAFVSSLE